MVVMVVWNGVSDKAWGNTDCALSCQCLRFESQAHIHHQHELSLSLFWRKQLLVLVGPHLLQHAPPSLAIACMTSFLLHSIASKDYVLWSRIIPSS
jgi:hypothetical protein